MIESNVSKQSYELLFEAINVGSKTHLKETLEYLLPSKKIADSNIGKKQIQYFESVNLIQQPYSNIVEIGCGDGELTKILSEEFPESNIIGVDRNKDLIEKNKRKFNQKNIQFICEDIQNESKKYFGDLVVGLHTCGDLTDESIDIVILSNSDIIITPCCYGKLTKNRYEYSKNNENIISKVKKLEGLQKQGRETYTDLIRESYRLLINIDRGLKLKTYGFDAEIVRLIPQKQIIKNKKQRLSTLNQTIIGTKQW